MYPSPYRKVESAVEVNETIMCRLEAAALDYRSAGVDIDAAQEALGPIRKLAQSTFRPGVLSDIGHFGGLFRLDTQKYAEPVLVASTDGVGTKLKVAFAANKHDTIGYDLVAHCVNDILVQGARPLFFLDYVATGKLDPKVVVAIVEGMANGCREFGLSLLGGETAEMPGFYAPGEYDVAGTIIGVVDQGSIIDGSALAPSNRLIGLPSNGLHTNGYSLARHILFEAEGLSVADPYPGLEETIADVLLRTHRSYLGALEPLLDFDSQIIKAIVHITGGGITDNVPRVLPAGLGASVDLGSWTMPQEFRALQELGSVPSAEMLRAFNVGVGLILVVAQEDVDPVVTDLEARGEEPFVMGEIVEIGEGPARVIYEGALE